MVSGRVQGVGFRWFVRESALKLGVGGWVRNRPDGSVEAEIEGTKDSIERLKDLMRSGPPHARVDRLDANPLPARAGPATFDIL